MTPTRPRGWVQRVSPLFAGVLFLLAASRWGSYVHVPGLPLFIGDIVVLAALAQTIYLWRKGNLTFAELRSAPRTLWIAGLFLTWALLRIVTRTALPMVAVRDLAPYAYAVAAPLAYLLPMRSTARTKTWIYGALTVHAAWYVAVVVKLIDPATTWKLADGAPIFSTRPDFDGAVFGIAIAFAVHHLAMGPRPRGPLALSALAGFIAINAYPLSTQHSRSGLVAAVLALAAVVGGWLLRERVGNAGRRALLIRGGVAASAVVAAVAALLFTVPGQRLIGGFDNSNEAGGTRNARVTVYSGMTDWITASPVRTAFGVGYGPNILTRSKTIQDLEGTEFKNVRSPHNYLLGTWARLGLIGAALALALFLAGGSLALRRLVSVGQPADAVAALIALTIPVVSLFGVILESPFGAIPYFWAVGQLCALTRRTSASTTELAPVPVSAGA